MQQYIPWVISAGSLMVALLSFLRGGRKDEKAELQQNMAQVAGIKEALLKLNFKTDQICTTTSETRADIKSQARELQSFSVRLTAVERDLKTAFKNIESLERREGRND